MMTLLFFYFFLCVYVCVCVCITTFMPKDQPYRPLPTPTTSSVWPVISRMAGSSDSPSAQ